MGKAYHSYPTKFPAQIIFYCDKLHLALDVFANSWSCAVSTERTILLPFTKDVFVNFSTNASCTSRIQTLRQGG